MSRLIAVFFEKKFKASRGHVFVKLFSILRRVTPRLDSILPDARGLVHDVLFWYRSVRPEHCKSVMPRRAWFWRTNRIITFEPLLHETLLVVTKVSDLSMYT